MLAYPVLFVFPVCMAFAAANDLFTMKIPNQISLALIAAFAAAVPLVGVDLQTVAMHAGVGALMLVAGIILFAYRLLGGGDAKLMAAASLWMGPDLLLPFIAYVTIFGGMLAIAILFYRKHVPADFFALPEWAMVLHRKGNGIPYGIAIAASALLHYPQTVWFAGLA